MSCAHSPSAATASASPFAGRILQATCSRSAMSARSPSSRPTCATASRSTAPSKAADHVINCVGVLFESGRNTFDAVQDFGARAVAEAARGVGAKLTHISAIGADAKSESSYARTKGRAEAAILETLPDAIILRPSIVFGPEDGFFNKFAQMARFSPVAATDRRRQHQVPAGLCHRCRRGRCPLRRRQAVGWHDLRTRRT